MAITIKSLQKVSDTLETNNYVFKDLGLDIEKLSEYSLVSEKNVAKNDLKPNFDLTAIITSLRNLFTTKPGERFLFPLYGLDLRQFLFRPITEVTAREIGERITRAIRNYEPRVVLQQCNVNGRPDDNLYEVDVIIEIPVFNTVSNINMVLDVKTSKFTFVT